MTDINITVTPENSGDASICSSFKEVLNEIKRLATLFTETQRKAGGDITREKLESDLTKSQMKKMVGKACKYNVQLWNCGIDIHRNVYKLLGIGMILEKRGLIPNDYFGEIQSRFIGLHDMVHDVLINIGEFNHILPKGVIEYEKKINA